MKKRFIPYDDKIVIEPMTKKGFLVTDQKPLEEIGKVIAVGKKVKFAKVGDLLCFSSWGCTKTPEVDGVEYYVVPEESDFIQGKYESKKK